MYLFLSIVVYIFGLCLLALMGRTKKRKKIAEEICVSITTLTFIFCFPYIGVIDNLKEFIIYSIVLLFVSIQLSYYETVMEQLKKLEKIQTLDKMELSDIEDKEKLILDYKDAKEYYEECPHSLFNKKKKEDRKYWENKMKEIEKKFGIYLD